MQCLLHSENFYSCIITEGNIYFTLFYYTVQASVLPVLLSRYIKIKEIQKFT